MTNAIALAFHYMKQSNEGSFMDFVFDIMDFGIFVFFYVSRLLKHSMAVNI